MPPSAEYAGLSKEYSDPSKIKYGVGFIPVRFYLCIENPR